MSQILTEEEFEEICSELMKVFSGRELSIRDAVRVMMMFSIESCVEAAPTLSVGLSELTKLFVQGLFPSVNESMRLEMELFDEEEGDEEV